MQTIHFPPNAATRIDRFAIPGLRFLFLLFTGLSCASADADVLTYNTRDAWNAAVTAPVLVDFENIVPPNQASPWYPTPPGITVGGVRFDIPPPASGDMALMVLGAGYYERPNAQLSSQGFHWSSLLTVTFPSPVRGAAFSIWGFGAGVDPAAHLYDFTLDTGGSASTIQYGYGQPSSFLGLVSTAPFTTVTIRSDPTTPGIINLDNVSYAIVPEPRTWLLGGGFGLVVLVYRHSKTALRAVKRPPS